MLQDGQNRDQGTVGSLAGLKPHSQHLCSASLFAKAMREKLKGVKNQNKTLDPKHIKMSFSSLFYQQSFGKVGEWALPWSGSEL